LKRIITFLGYLIENGTIAPTDDKVKAVVNYPAPQSRKALQRFLGLTSYLRCFMKGYALEAKPLSDLLRKTDKSRDGRNIQLDDQCLISFENLKSLLATAPVLRLYDPCAVTEVHTDASKFGFGGILMQKDSEDQLLHPVEFMSRKTTQCEEKYSAYELEVLAVINAVKKWRIYLLGINLTIVTDCVAFAMTMKKDDVPPRVARWAMYLQEFKFTVQHRAGSQMKHVDALSSQTCFLIEESTKYRLREAQNKDEWIKAVKTVLDSAEIYEDFFVRNNILYKDVAKELLVQMKKKLYVKG